MYLGQLLLIGSFSMILKEKQNDDWGARGGAASVAGLKKGDFFRLAENGKQRRCFH